MIFFFFKHCNSIYLRVRGRSWTRNSRRGYLRNVQSHDKLSDGLCYHLNIFKLYIEFSMYFPENVMQNKLFIRRVIFKNQSVDRNFQGETNRSFQQ